MIIAEINPIAPDFYLVRFSDPTENLDDKKFIPVRGTMSEVERIMYFKNRTYILATLTAFFKQRAMAINPRHLEIYGKLRELKSNENVAFRVLCKWVAANTAWIISISPPLKSKFRHHFDTVIQPILDFCESNPHTHENNKSLQRTT